MEDLRIKPKRNHLCPTLSYPKVNLFYKKWLDEMKKDGNVDFCPTEYENKLNNYWHYEISDRKSK